ncbi:MAG: Lrp/AsnC family transcriptional regulator [Candidatus Kariarchaeaceae archaeon]|jgi:DNA-binding Lrp family transcriptional regulator
MELDIYDLKILQHLKKNARKTLKELEAEIDLKVSTIHNRIKRLEDSNVIKQYMAIIDHKSLDYNMISFIMIEFVNQDNQLDQVEVAEQISQLPNVEEVHLVTGEFDILLKVRSKDIDDLSLFVTKNLKQIPGVGGSRTFVSLRSVKQYFDEPFLTDLVVNIQ